MWEIDIVVYNCWSCFSNRWSRVLSWEKSYRSGTKPWCGFSGRCCVPLVDCSKNIEYGPRQLKKPVKEINEITDKYMKIVGLEKYGHLWPKQLSGGMRKRVDLARALANDPEILLMDEPFGALDVITKQNLQVEIMNLFSHVKKTVLFVTHDLEEAIFLADRVVVTSERPGKIKETVEIPFERPRLPKIKTSVEFQKMREKLSSYLGISQELEGGCN